MTREEAIKILAQYVDNECYTPRCKEAHQMAISALREQDDRRWIPVTDRSPEFGERVMFMKCNQICKWNSNVGCVKPYGVSCILENMSPTDKKLPTQTESVHV